MRLLVDTSVWSLSLRRKRTATLHSEDQHFVSILLNAVTNGTVAMIGPIRQELLSGIKDRAQFDKLKGTLRHFSDEALTTEDYEEAAHLYNLCRSQGVECGPVDILISAVAKRRGWGILASDAGLLRCLEVIDPTRTIRRTP